MTVLADSSFSWSTPLTTAMDTGTASTPTARPSAFTPLGTGTTITAPLDSADSGQNSQEANRPNTFDPLTGTTTTSNPGY